MINVKDKTIGKNRHKITVSINGSDELIIAEVIALHRQLLKTARGTNIISEAMDQLQEYLKERNKESE